MVTVSFSESFYNIFMDALRDNINDPDIPKSEVEKANRLLYLLASKAHRTKDDDGDINLEISWYERTCCDVGVQSIYILQREFTKRLALESEIEALKAEIEHLNNDKESSDGEG